MIGGSEFLPLSVLYHSAKIALQKSEDLGARPARDNTLEFEMKAARLYAIAFAAICSEAYINEEYTKHDATRALFTEIEKVDARVKWLMLPRLLGHTSFDRGAQPFQTYDELVKVRNNHLFHLKPAASGAGASGGNVPRLPDITENPLLARRYVECVGDMIRELSRLTTGEVQVPDFLSGPPATRRVWASAATPFESLGPREEPER